jgi:hypothetical protein
MLAFRRPCADHRTTLFAYVDRREIGPSTGLALAHLDRCRTCELDLSEVALVVAALGRLRRELETVEPPQDAWLRLRERVARPIDPWRWRASLGSLATSAMLVAVLVLPVTIGGPETAENGSELPGPLVELRREAEYLASIRVGSVPPAPRVVRDGGSVPRYYPPEIAQVRKEVPARPAIGRSSQPI